MRLSVLEFTEQMIPAVRDFNARLRAAGQQVQFPGSPVSAWLPKTDGRRLFQESYLVQDEQSMVRGAYLLKHQDFWIDGRTVSVADLQMPISEGIVDRAFGRVGIMLVWDARRRNPLIYALGMGDYKEAMPQLLAACGWELTPVPFFFRVVRPFRFLRNLTYLRHSSGSRLLLDLAAFSGLGWLALKASTACHRSRVDDVSVQVERVDEFSTWADVLWEACRNDYAVAAVRDRATLEILYPREQEKFVRLKVTRRRRVIGWAVLLNTPLTDHAQFGNMRLGSIVDGLAASPDVRHVVAAARTWLERQDVDLIVSNQSHRVWCDALRACGFTRGPSNYLFAASAELAQRLKEANIGIDRMHWTRGDGDGPIHL